MERELRVGRLISVSAVTLAFCVACGFANAQSTYGPGQSWSSTWGPSATNRSLRLQEAQAIRSAEQSSGGPSTVVYNTNSYDNRANYQDLSGVSGSLGAIEFQIGDQIGQNTNSVGAMNTGETTIEINGDGNLVDATNSAESEGCIDSSVVNETLSLLDSYSEGDSNISNVASSTVPPCS
ncbi:hypothetical protein [Nioella ostreopsis]|uniref:hypothetical protein n=1 Tax=Nioella ostreopsis TaxID=2448479 RepID=UPI000FDA2007|nr:hypothetical protein [Nioella ostreopsis]